LIEKVFPDTPVFEAISTKASIDEFLGFNKVLLTRLLMFFSSNIIDEFVIGYGKGEGSGHGATSIGDAIKRASLHDKDAAASSEKHAIRIFGETKVVTYLVFDDVAGTVSVAYGGTTTSTKMIRNGFTSLNQADSGKGYAKQEVGRKLGNNATSIEQTAIAFALNVPADITVRANYMTQVTCPEHLSARNLTGSEAKMLDEKVAYLSEVLVMALHKCHEVRLWLVYDSIGSIHSHRATCRRLNKTTTLRFVSFRAF
jgi:hypothetical protein